jgi:hypothetical protein
MPAAKLLLEFYMVFCNVCAGLTVRVILEHGSSKAFAWLRNGSVFSYVVDHDSLVYMWYAMASACITASYC